VTRLHAMADKTRSRPSQKVTLSLPIKIIRARHVSSFAIIAIADMGRTRAEETADDLGLCILLRSKPGETDLVRSSDFLAGISLSFASLPEYKFRLTVSPPGRRSVVSHRHVLALLLALGRFGATATDIVDYASIWLTLEGFEKKILWLWLCLWK
jgi:hypothetical protein